MRMTKPHTVFLVFLSISVIGCTGFVRKQSGPELVHKSAPKRPEWITRLPQSNDYFYAVGMETSARSLQEARESAIQTAVTEVANFIGIRAQVRFEQRTTELTKQVLNEITTSSKARLEGSRLSEMYYEQYRDETYGSARTTYDVYVLLRIPYRDIDRERARQEKEIEDALVQARSGFIAGTTSQREGNLPHALRRWFDALEIIEEVSPSAPLKYEIINQMKDDINQLRVSFSVEAIDTGGTSTLPATLPVQAYMGEGDSIPARQIPLTFRFRSGSGTLDEVATTDSDGSAVCNVYDVNPSTQPVLIESRISAERMMPSSSRLPHRLVSELTALLNSKAAIHVFSVGFPPVSGRPVTVPRSVSAPIVRKAPTGAPVAIEVKSGNKYVSSDDIADLFLPVMIDMRSEGAIELARPPMNLGLVLDRSGSMDAKGKMDYTKQAAIFLIDNLTPADILSTVAYDGDVSVIDAAAPVRYKDLLKHKVSSIEPSGATNLSGGILEGYQQVLVNARDDRVNRVILLSDGKANRGITNEKELFSMAKEYRRKGIAMTTIGVGDGFNEELMLGLAEYSGGNYYFARDPEEIPGIFEHELEQLVGVVAQNVRLEFHLQPGVELVHTYGNVNPARDSSRDGASLYLGDLSSGERRVILVELQLPHREAGTMTVATARISYDDVVLVANRVERSDAISVTYTHDQQLLAAGENQEVDRYLIINCAAEVMFDAMTTLEVGQYGDAIDMLREQSDTIGAFAREHGDQWLLERAEIFRHCADEMATMKISRELHHSNAKRMRKEIHYQTYEMMRRHHSREKTRKRQP